MLTHEFLSQYGALIVFSNVLASSLGLPFPSITTLITIGASVTIAKHDLSHTIFSFVILLGAAVAGGVIGDLVWFQWGKRYGKRALRMVCKPSLSRITYVTRLERFFARRGARALLFARLVPGLSLVAVPLCGAMSIKARTFILFDCAGTGLWACAGLLTGALLAGRIDVLFRHIPHLGWRASIIAAAPTLFLLYKWLARRAPTSKPINIPRVTADELHGMLEDKKKPVVLEV